ncbi:D-alanyl-D-alanine carboxypeptidase family protein [uncultured Pseudoflavonifractor sp.]|uniref:D-alanyl-D-alanine carboxypeptidase family protein n=1 Tax=uncultured Pseudoflavonifractor sp. TaxID=1221379 RepID=UPI0025E756E0|nr:D-alanyl-D-alanine carboxypeptidase family protein [uncultured Pseudoflavonifractor sp.]
MKRVFTAAVAAVLCLTCLPLTARGAGEPELSASCAILVDAESGRVLMEKNADEERGIASITKLMTALVAAESTSDLDRTVTIQKEWTLAEGSSMYLREGEELTLRELLYGLLLVSGNDAALAIAGFCAGDVDTFVEWMNLRAQELGMEHTHFVNPNGLPAEGHYSTAADMAKLAIVVMEQPDLAEIVGTKSITLAGRTMTNHNKLLWRYEGCVGMKTGYTDAAGRTLVSCAERDGQRLIAVTLNAPNDWADHAAMFDYGFSQWPSILLASAGRDFRSLPVTGSLVRFVPVQIERNVRYPLAEHERVTAKIDLPDVVEAPVEEGDIAGSLTYYVDGKEVGSTYLVYSHSVESNVARSQSILDRILSLFRRDGEGVKAAFYPQILDSYCERQWS